LRFDGIQQGKLLMHYIDLIGTSTEVGCSALLDYGTTSIRGDSLLKILLYGYQDHH
jgi:hypothetical protein